MAEFKLGRIRFVWKGDWTPTTQYYVDDVIRFGGRTYICAIGHVSDSEFYTDLNYNPTKWNQMSDGQSWKDEWATSTVYKINDIVKYGGLLYIANTPHTSNSSVGSGTPGTETTTGLEADQAKWDLFGEGVEWKNNWTISTRYKKNDIVRYGGTTYVANVGHTSETLASTGLEGQSSYWDVWNQGFEYKGDWTALTRYKVNDVVKEGANLYVCTVQHTATSVFGNDLSSYWSVFVKGFEYENTWSNVTVYQPGDIVRYGGNQYIARTIHDDTTPTAVGQTDWSLYSENMTFQSDWDVATSYKIGDVVNLNGYTYRAKIDAPNFSDTVTATDAGTDYFTVTDTSSLVVGWAVKFTGSTFGNVASGNHYYIKQIVSATEFTITETPGGAVFTPTTASGTMTVDAGSLPGNVVYWDRLNSGILWRGEWTDDTEYFLGDSVRYGSNAYICIQNHRAEGDDGSSIGAEGGGAANSRPDQDTSGTYWNVLSIGSDVDVLTTTGDLVYYSGAGPTRLPVGIEGQVLTSSGTIPQWTTLGKVDHVYYVAPNGTDLPAPIHGATLDMPWATIRYACEQIEKGALNPNAQHLLEMNRVFLQREVTSFIEYNVINNISPFTSAFDYDEHKCERDVGWIIDRLIWDIGHGGNLKMRAAAQTFVDALGDGPYSAESEDVPYANLSAEKDESLAAYGHLLTIIGNVLNQTDPTTAYQTPGGADSTAVALQYKDADLVAETGVYASVTSLLAIVTDTISAGDNSAIPERVVPNNIVNVKAGEYKEVLPIIVPAETCILGDELRTTKVRAASATDRPLDISDSYYSIQTLAHFSSVARDIVSGTSVTPTTGNTATQDVSWPLADDAVTGVQVSKLVDVMKHQVDYRLGTKHTATYTDPTGYNSSYLVTFGNARHLIQENKKFLQEEIIAWFAENYPNLKFGKTDTREDVGHIVDALVYDLTYGGYYQTLNAAKAYWDGEGNSSLIPDSIKGETLESHAFLRTLLIDIVNNTAITKKNTTINQYRNSNVANSTARDFVTGHLDIITNAVGGDSTGADLPNSTITTISSNTITTLTDHGLQVGDIFIPLETSNGMTKDLTYWVESIPASNQLTISTTYGGSAATLSNGSGLTIPAHKVDMPAATDSVSSTTALITAAETLDAQQEALVTLVTNYISTTYPTLTYNVAKCERDTRLILEAVMFDFQLNSNFATLIAGNSYLRSSASDVFDLNQKAATRASFQYLASVIAGDTATYLNSDATAASRVATLMDMLDTVFYGASNEGAVCATDSRMAYYAKLKLEQNRAFLKAEVSAYIDDQFTDTVTNTSISGNTITISDTSWLKRNTAVRFSGTVFGGISADTTYYVQDVVNTTTFTIATTRYATTSLTLSTASGSMTVAMYYNEALCLRDVDTYIDAIKWDLEWVSNYKSRYVARYYVNAALGSHEEDFYYVRNGCGIRNQTLNGLNGDLLPENSYGTSRVSAGAYVSLDPGWGPDDFRTWIIARSPYTQNCTTFGYGAIGQKIDGNLHNGGNDSMVSNDFTQVISDGIGAWVENNGRAELVSVFTYYSHVGYLATNGGRIRGTNGNNSYGDFGSVAEGFDTTEIEGTAIVDNKFQYEATVGSVITDGANQVLLFEYGNAGEQYTETTFGIFGAGANASVEVDKELRDGAVHNVRLLDNVDDSTTAPEAEGNFGGFGYISNSNTAQGGTTTQITIAATDSETSTAYVGMRIYLTGGTGVGQFGNIATYNSGTKVATVTKESDGSAGFDHILPGTTIAAPDASTTYTIEPRLTFTAPPFTTTAKTLATSTTWADIAYSNVYESFENTSADSTSGSGTGAVFDITKKGSKYLVRLDSGGTGYAINDTLTFNGTSLNGTSTNNLVLTVTSVNSVTGAITAFDKEGFGSGGNFVALPSASGNTVNYSKDGTTWSAVTTLPVSTTWTSIAGGRIATEELAGTFITGRSYTITESGDTPWLTIGSSSIVAGTTFVATGPGTFTSTVGKATPNAARIIAIAGGVGIDDTAYSEDGGATWTAGGNLPSTGDWVDVAYGDSKWVAIKTGSNATAVTTNGGATWTAGGNLPASTTWESVAYGGGYWVAIASGGSNVAYSLDNGTTWSAGTGLSSSNWKSVTYGNNRFVAVSNTSGTKAAISLDKGVNWTETTLPATKTWSHVEYGQGVFLAVNDTDNTGATSPDGLTWTSRTLSTSANGFIATAFGNPDQTGKFISIDDTSGTVASETSAGATTVARAFVAENKIFAIRIHEPGSGYTTAPSLTITDPNNTYEAPTSVRLANGVLGNPSFRNRGTGYISASADIDTGDGYADFYQSGSFIAVRRLSKVPAVGSNVVFAHLPNRVFKLVQVLTLLGAYDGSYTAFLQISPDMSVFDSPEHGTAITTRIRYSQFRLTGHDFLDIGTGNFTETNYPGIPTQSPVQANETVDSGGGRVFFTSTDQDGNFRVGDLFSIEQSTGVATLNADAFNISGLQELTLGEVTLGGGSASITEFSTDPFFTENSDSIVPTQRAIKAYISSQIGGGGASLNVNSVTAGFIYIANNEITTTTGGIIEMKGKFNFQGGVVGMPLAFNYFLT